MIANKSKIEKPKLFKMNWISIVTILISIITVIAAFFAVIWPYNKQINSGKYLAFEISTLYCYNLVNNGIDFTAKKFKDSKEDKELYLRVLKNIEIELNSLDLNPYFMSLMKDYPEIVTIRLLTSNEICKLEKRENLLTTGICHKEYIKLYQKVKKDLPKELFEENGKYHGIDGDIKKLGEIIDTKLKEIDPILFH
jgi:hypothetical protein